jgi:DNA-binding NarL/FixJ family response regulator
MQSPDAGESVATRTAPARLIIVDDHELVRMGLRSLLAGERELQVVGEASNGREAVDLCRQLLPDLVLMDVRMPELDGLAATRAIKRVSPHTSVLMLTVYESADYYVEALKAGAAGYVLKDVGKREIVAAIRHVLGGEHLLHPQLALQALRRLASESEGHAPAPLGELTAREREVLRLLAQGQTNRDIARTLNIGLRTVKTHVEHIIAKLGVSDRVQAAVRAVERGLLNDMF